MIDMPLIVLVPFQAKLKRNAPEQSRCRTIDSFFALIPVPLVRGIRVAERDLTDELASVIEGLGFSLVECKAQGVRGTFHVNVVVHRRGGISLDDCAEIHRTLVPRIEVITGNRDISVEVSSPGIGRKLKSQREYAVFVGMPVKVLDLENEWITGILQDADDRGITLARDNAIEHYAYPEIRAARLNDV